MTNSDSYTIHAAKNDTSKSDVGAIQWQDSAGTTYESAEVAWADFLSLLSNLADEEFEVEAGEVRKEKFLAKVLENSPVNDWTAIANPSDPQGGNWQVHPTTEHDQYAHPLLNGKVIVSRENSGDTYKSAEISWSPAQ